MKREELGLSNRNLVLAAGLVAIVVVHALAALFVAQRISDRIIRREAQISQDFINRMYRVQNPGAALFEPPQPSPALLAFVKGFTELPDVIRINIYSPDHFIRYSSQEGLIGVKFEEPNDELQEAFGGGLVSSLETMTIPPKAEHSALALNPGDPFIEIYFPVSDQNGKPAAVVELYKRPGGAEAVIVGLKSLVWSAAGASGVLLALLFGVCFWWAGRGQAASYEASRS